jgi:hypothetical protein
MSLFTISLNCFLKHSNMRIQICPNRINYYGNDLLDEGAIGVMGVDGGYHSGCHGFQVEPNQRAPMDGKW